MRLWWLIFLLLGCSRLHPMPRSQGHAQPAGVVTLESIKVFEKPLSTAQADLDPKRDQQDEDENFTLWDGCLAGLGILGGFWLFIGWLRTRRRR